MYSAAQRVVVTIEAPEVVFAPLLTAVSVRGSGLASFLKDMMALTTAAPSSSKPSVLAVMLWYPQDDLTRVGLDGGFTVSTFARPNCINASSAALLCSGHVRSTLDAIVELVASGFTIAAEHHHDNAGLKLATALHRSRSSS